MNYILEVTEMPEIPIIPAWYGEKSLKESAVKRLKWHREQDSFEQQIWFNIETNRGCQLGCLCHYELLLDSYRDETIYQKTSRLFGLPLILVQLFEEIFEALPNEDIILSNWVIDSIEAIAVGADLSFFDRKRDVLYEKWNEDYTCDPDGALEFSEFIISKLKECPILTQQIDIPHEVEIELCSRNLWCPSEHSSKELVNIYA